MSYEMFFAYMKKNKLESKIDKEDVEITESVNPKEMPQRKSASHFFF
jgi:hypothetical protein